MLVAEGCSFIKYDNPNLIPENSTIIFQSTPIWRIPFINNFPKSCKVLFWNLHPRNFQSNYIRMETNKKWLLPLNLFSFFRRQKLRLMVEFLMGKKALVYMDGENYEKTRKDLSLSTSLPIYLPILTNSPMSCGSSNIDTANIKCLWVGRLDNFKIEILLFLLKALNDLRNDNITFTIIGSGLEAYRVEALSHDLKFLNVNLLGDVLLENLDETIINYDVIFAMGTSALDAAKLYKPVICLDFSYSVVSDGYQFHMIYDNEHYNVGEEIAAKHVNQETNIAVIMNNIFNGYGEESLASYNYWKKNHSIDVVKNSLIQLLSDGECTLNELFMKQFHRPDVVTKLLNIMIYHFKKPVNETEINQI